MAVGRKETVYDQVGRIPVKTQCYVRDSLLVIPARASVFEHCHHVALYCQCKCKCRLFSSVFSDRKLKQVTKASDIEDVLFNLLSNPKDSRVSVAKFWTVSRAIL